MTLAIWTIISSTASSDHLIGETPVRLKVSPRARRMRLSVDPRTRSVLLTVPRRVSRRRALAWASGHRAWIEKALADIPPVARLRAGRVGPAPRRAASDRLGCRRGRGGSSGCEGRLVAGGPLDGLERRILRWLKAEALASARAARPPNSPPRRASRWRGSASAIRCRAGGAARARARSAIAGG